MITKHRRILAQPESEQTKLPSTMRPSVISRTSVNTTHLSSFSIAKRTPFPRGLSSAVPKVPRVHSWRFPRSLRFSTAVDHYSRPDQDSIDHIEVSIRRLPIQFLRAADLSLVDVHTLQRNDVQVAEANGKPTAFPCASSLSAQRPDLSILRLDRTGEGYEIEWTDGRKSKFALDWIKDQCNLWNQRLRNRQSGGTGLCSPDDRVPWTGWTEESFRSSPELSMPFRSLIQNEDAMKQALSVLYHYGIILITQTPIHDGGYSIAAMAAALGGGSVKIPDNNVYASSSILPRYGTSSAVLQLPNGGSTDGPYRTLYGSVWSTSSGGMAAGTRLVKPIARFSSDGVCFSSLRSYCCFAASLTRPMATEDCHSIPT
jgi:hypothetical protein